MDSEDITDRARKHHEAQMEIPDPTPIERIISWVKIAFATKKVIMLVWAFFFGVAGVAVKGNIDEVNPWKEAAVEVGLIEPDPIEQQEATDNALLDELLNLQEDMGVVERRLETLREQTYKALNEPHTHDLQEHAHNPPDLTHTHPVVAAESVEHVHEPVDQAHTHPSPVFEMSDAVKEVIAKEVELSFIQEMQGHVDILH